MERGVIFSWFTTLAFTLLYIHVLYRKIDHWKIYYKNNINTKRKCQYVNIDKKMIQRKIYLCRYG